VINSMLLDPEGRSQKATLVVVVLLVVGISCLRVTQRSATKLYMHIRADIAHRSTVSDFSIIF